MTARRSWRARLAQQGVQPAGHRQARVRKAQARGAAQAAGGRIAWSASAGKRRRPRTRLKAKAEEERKEKEARKKVAAKRMDDDAFFFRAHCEDSDSLFFKSSYWTCIFTGEARVVYVEETDAAARASSLRKEIDRLGERLREAGARAAPQAGDATPTCTPYGRVPQRLRRRANQARRTATARNQESVASVRCLAHGRVRARRRRRRARARSGSARGGAAWLLHRTDLGNRRAALAAFRLFRARSHRRPSDDRIARLHGVGAWSRSGARAYRASAAARRRARALAEAGELDRKARGGLHRDIPRPFVHRRAPPRGGCRRPGDVREQGGERDDLDHLRHQGPRARRGGRAPDAPAASLAFSVAALRDRRGYQPARAIKHPR